MAIAHDAVTESVRTGTEDPYTFTHTPTGTPASILVFVLHGTSATDHVAAVDWGGIPLERVGNAFGFVTDTATELGSAEVWFRGWGLAARADDTVNVDLTSGTTDDIHFVAATQTAATSIVEVICWDSDGNNQANPSAVMGVGGRTGIAYAALYSGLDAVASTAMLTGMTALHDHDFGAFISRVDRQTTPSTSDFTIGWTAISDDVAAIYVSLTEAETGYPQIIGMTQGQTTANGASHVVKVPNDASVDDGWLILMPFDGNTTITWPDASYVAIPTSIEAVYTSNKLQARWHVIDGTEGASITVTTVANEQQSYQTFLFKDGTFTGSPEGAADASLDPPSVSPAAGSAAYCWIAGYAGDSSTVAAPTVYPTGYNFWPFRFTGGTTGGVTVSRKNATASSEDPSAYTASAGGTDVRAFTIALQAAAAAAGRSQMVAFL